MAWHLHMLCTEESHLLRNRWGNWVWRCCAWPSYFPSNLSRNWVYTTVRMIMSLSLLWPPIVFKVISRLFSRLQGPIHFSQSSLNCHPTMYTHAHVAPATVTTGSSPHPPWSSAFLVPLLSLSSPLLCQGQPFLASSFTSHLLGCCSGPFPCVHSGLWHTWWELSWPLAVHSWEGHALMPTSGAWQVCWVMTTTVHYVTNSGGLCN